MEFASILTRDGDNGFRGASDCEVFGMAYGCRPDCPVFMAGNCEVEEENIKAFK